MTEPQFSAVFEQAGAVLVHCLRALESAQQSILFQAIGRTQKTLDDAFGDRLERIAEALKRVEVPAQAGELHAALRSVVVHLGNARSHFVRRARWPDFGEAYLSSRGEQCKALEIAYRWRDQMPGLAPYFLLDGVRAPLPQPAAGSDRIVRGLQHFEDGDAHNEYSLYVPENYQPAQRWPLIVALHGGYGRGDEYIWSWLRAARSRGYLVLAPKSYGPTWSIMQPELDRESILNMLETVSASYAIDTARIFLTGLSDGATFSYLLGFAEHQRFAALAPIAGVLSPMTDPMLRAGDGKTLPLHIIHGVHDAIFAVETVRSMNELLRSLGYQVHYTELPEWGHALTTGINETLVLPWFEQLETPLG